MKINLTLTNEELVELIDKEVFLDWMRECCATPQGTDDEISALLKSWIKHRRKQRTAQVNRKEQTT